MRVTKNFRKFILCLHLLGLNNAAGNNNNGNIDKQQNFRKILVNSDLLAAGHIQTIVGRLR